MNALDKSVDSSQNAEMFTECVVDLHTTPVNLLVDVGARVSILNEAPYHDNFSRFLLHPTNEKLQAYDKSTIDVRGIISLTVRLKDTVIDHFPFYSRELLKWIAMIGWQ